MATPNNNGSISAPATKTFTAQFTKRDVILYALGIGCCSDGSNDTGSSDRELQFVYERHPKFEAFPTFLLALSFVADQQMSNSNELPSTCGIRPFPPPAMTNYLDDGSKCGLLPKEFFKNENDAKEMQDLPILHISQSLILHDEMKLSADEHVIDPPTQIELETKILSVTPRSIGTFLTTETKYHQLGSCIATAHMVALVLGLDPDKVISWKAPTNNRHVGVSRETNQSTRATSGNENDSMQKTVAQYSIPKNAALLYRLSGDYNPIHVEGNLLGDKDRDDDDDETAEQTIQKESPILHGLCTMGYALRAVLRHVDQYQCNKAPGREVRLVSIRCNFMKPVCVGDTLRVEVWNENDCTSEKSTFGVWFRVYRDIGCSNGCNKNQSDDVVVEKGKAQFCLKTPERKSVQMTSSRL